MRSVNTARLSVLGAVTISLALALSGCGAAGGGVSEDKVAKALEKEFKADPDLKGTFSDAKISAFTDCMAAVVIKKGNKDDVKAWLDGKKKADDIRGFEGDQSKDPASAACAKKLE